MSLRSFHIVFITICTLLCAFMVMWVYWLAPDNAPFIGGVGIVGIIGLLAMPIYGTYFLRKANKLQL
jgi:hypothetical protein